MSTTFKLLIFDWDGTLADSAGHIVAAMQGAIDTLKLPPRSDQSIRELIGLGLGDAMQRLFPELDTQDLLRLLDEYRRIAPGSYAHEAPLFEGVRETLIDLHGKGYQLAVATGKARPGLNRSFVAHAFLKPLLAISRCADETAAKPDPLMLREILDETGLAPGQALMVGDTDYDMDMARALGMPALGVACGVHDAGRLLRAGARAVVEDVPAAAYWIDAA